MFNDGYDAYCQHLLSASPLVTQDKGILCGCTEFLRDSAMSKPVPQTARSNWSAHTSECGTVNFTLTAF